MTDAKDLISSFMIAISNCALYSKEHEAFDELAKKTLSSLNTLLKEKLEIMVLDSELVVDNAPLRDAGLHKTNIIKRMKRKGISRVDFLKGIGLSEIKQFIVDMASPGKSIKSYPHIKTGAVDLLNAQEGKETENSENDTEDLIENIQSIFHSASDSGKMNIARLDEVVVQFISAIKKEANVLKYLSPVKSFSEYTYTHASNVSVLSVFQAETLGLNDDLLYDIGIAAILHDAGKLFVSKEILDKKGRLDEQEFNEIKKHPSFGAAYLAKMDDIPRLAPVVAFEHHQKYNLSGYPVLQDADRTQHICSQIVAISDFFDALRSRRPYRESMEIKDIFVLMQKGSGTDFNPILLDNFIGSIDRTLSDL
jgi:HD-GYP domain-containing protein (c-di-GMP phosphodiesterase class II)